MSEKKSLERERLKAAHAALAAAQKSVVAARAAIDTATQSRWRAREDLERLREEEKQPLGFVDLDGPLAAIAGGSAGVMALDRTEPRRARIAELEKEFAAWKRAGELADQSLALRERDLGAASSIPDEAARAVVAAEANWPGLKRRYDELCGEVRALRAHLASLAKAAPSMRSAHVCEIDVEDALGQNLLYGPERDSSFGDFLTALKSDPDAKLAK